MVSWIRVFLTGAPGPTELVSRWSREPVSKGFNLNFVQVGRAENLKTDAVQKASDFVMILIGFGYFSEGSRIGTLGWAGFPGSLAGTILATFWAWC